MRWKSNLLIKLACLLAIALCSHPATGFDDNLLAEVAAREKIAAQKVETEYVEAIASAARLGRASPAKAQTRLEAILAMVEADRVLTAERREALKRSIKEKIRATQAKAGNRGSSSPRRAKDTLRPEEIERLTDEERIRRLLDGIKTLQKEGKLQAAQERAADLARRLPQDPAAQAAKEIAGRIRELDSERDLKEERRGRSGDAGRDIARSGLPARGDMEFPRDWKELSRRRISAEPPMTAKERDLLASLNKLVTADFKNARLEDVLDYMQDRLGQPVIIHKLAMQAVDISYDTPVTLRAKNVTARFLLRRLVSDLGLTYVIRDELIQVVTPDQARSMMVVKTYYVGDLAANIWEAADLVGLIQETIDPESWRANGGAGTIVYHERSRSLVIKQTAEFHSVLSSGLRKP